MLHYTPTGNTRSGSPRKSIPAYGYSMKTISWQSNHSKKVEENEIDDWPACLAIRSTHLCIRGSLGPGTPREMCYGCISRILSKVKEIKIDP